MKTTVYCLECTSQHRREPVPIQLQISDSNLYNFSCEHEHNNVAIDQKQKFELLFESAVHAINDGYLREAVSSIASSLERFYEFFIKIIADKNNIDDDLFTNTWKQIAKQSERQLGSFINCYMSEFKEVPPVLSDKQQKFRNDIIHKGYFPTYDEVIGFGQSVLDLMFPILVRLKNYYNRSLEATIAKHITNLDLEAKKSTERPIMMAGNGIIGLTRATENFVPITLNEYLAGLKK